VRPNIFNRFMCWLGKCTACRVLDREDGIGGQCIHCGRVHGWVTREELRAYSDRYFSPGECTTPPSPIPPREREI
jgi:hypothetical protein